MKKLTERQLKRLSETKTHIEVINKEVNELEELDKMVKSFELLNEEARYRAMQYLASRYSNYLPSREY